MPLAVAAVPVDIHLPAGKYGCSMARPCPVAILSPGYGMASSEYGFVTRYLNEAGYLVVALRDTASGVALDRNGRIAEQVQAMARTASQSIAAVVDANAPLYHAFDWRRLLLVGHSLGGDSSAQFAADYPGRVAGLISLDSRRVALPRSADIPVLTVRASDTLADPGVLPDEARLTNLGREHHLAAPAASCTMDKMQTFWRAHG